MSIGTSRSRISHARYKPAKLMGMTYLLFVVGLKPHETTSLAVLDVVHRAADKVLWIGVHIVQDIEQRAA